MRHSAYLWMIAAAMLGGIPALAQYPGHVNTQPPPQPGSTLRAVAVLEWTGSRAHPAASRLVPVSLFDGQTLQDGALYLARPVPLALDSGTEYEIEAAGLPEGWFDVDGARQIADDWFGYGILKPYLPPAPKPLHPAQHPPTVVRDVDEDKPHFVRRDQSAGASAPSGGGTSSQSKTAPAAPVDPDRPKLRRRHEESAPQQTSVPAPETSIAAADPNRPRLSYGKPANLEKEETPLTTVPVNMEQRVAVSDAASVGTQSFAYDWASPEDGPSAQRAIEAQALQLLAAAAPPKAAAAARHTPRIHTRVTQKKMPLEPLTHIQFSAFALTNGSSPTLVLTADEPDTTRSIAVIGMQDIYGKILVLWHSITDDNHLDVTPRMRLVDAVDPRGDGRGNLLFEERNTNDRRFVLYVVGANTAMQVFATDPLPLHPVASTSSE